MINEPLLQDNIISAIIRNFQHYFSYNQWINYALGTLLLLSLTCFFLKRHMIVPRVLFPLAADCKTKPNAIAWLFLFLIFGVYTSVVFALEDSIFNNYDLMNLGTIYIFFQGVTPFLNHTRFAPIAFFDLNIVYAVTHNFFIINFYIILKQFVIAILFYNYLNFLTKPTRLFLVGALLFAPTLFWINNIIFAEQNLLIFILLSLIFIRKFSASKNFFHLLGFAFFTAFAIYSKETTAIFYFGILISGIIAGIFSGELNLSTLFNPARLIKKFPIEFLIFIICFSFAFFYFFIANTSDSNIYINLHHKSLPELLNLYKFEITISALACLIMLKKLLARQISFSLFDEGPMLGGTLILLVLIFHLKIAPVAQHVELKSYYALLPAVFGIIYIVRNLTNTKWLSLFFASLTIYAAYANYKIYRHEVGAFYRETAEFFASEQTSVSKLSIMFSPHTEEMDWIREGWAITFQYYFPHKNIIFKFSDLAAPNSTNDTTLFLYNRLQKYMKPIIGNNNPSSGDYYIIQKNRAETDFSLIAKLPHNLVFENKLFRIYRIK